MTVVRASAEDVAATVAAVYRSGHSAERVYVGATLMRDSVEVDRMETGHWPAVPGDDKTWTELVLVNGQRFRLDVTEVADR